MTKRRQLLAYLLVVGMAIFLVVRSENTRERVIRVERIVKHPKGGDASPGQAQQPP